MKIKNRIFQKVMSRNGFFFLIATCLIIFNLLLVNKVSELRNSNLIESKEKEVSEIELEVLIELMNKQYNDEDRIVSGTLTDDKREEITSLTNVVGSSNLLVLRYSELNCLQCIDSVIPELKKIASKIGNENIILIASYVNKKDLNIFRRINEIPFKIYNIKENGLGLEIEKDNIPFLFVLDSSLTAKLVHIPQKDRPDLVKEYLQVVFRRFFDN